MQRRRFLLAALLIYVGLDLALPAMPGAFVFDAGDSVESLDVGRARLSARLVTLPTPPGSTPLPRLCRESPPAWRVPVAAGVAHPAIHRPRRAAGEPPPRAEDPH